MTIPPVSLFFKNTSAFSLVELLVAISILATISVVAYVSYAGHMKLANNATRVHTIDALHLSLSDYAQMKKTLPEPNSNSISYDERGTYMHSLSGALPGLPSGAYGVSGYVSDTFLPKGYVNFPATDPESSQFYGYGKLTDNSAFDVAAVLYDEVTGGYKTYLRGTYSRERLTSLIRAYSSSAFVSQDSTENLPYNPYERKITGHILNFSGSVEARNSSGEAISLTGELNSGDTIVVGTGGSALLHISDGSELSLGSATTETILKLTTLAYSDDHNLASKVKLLLSLGEVWTEAPHLRSEPDSESNLSIETDSAVAAVRGTVFGVSRDGTGSTTLSLASGKLEVEKIDTTGTAPFTSTDNFSTTATGGFVLQDAKSYMVVPEGATPITLEGIANTNDATISTGTLAPSEVEKKIQRPPFSLGYRPKAEKISFFTGANVEGNAIQTGILSVTFNNPGADSYELSFGTGEVTDAMVFGGLNPNPTLTGTLSTTGTLMTITGAFAYISEPHLTRTYTFRVCFQGKCSAPDIKHLGGATFSFDSFRVWGETCKYPLPIFCQQSNLVAYAPYNGGDWKFFTRDMPLLATSSGVTSSGTNGVEGVLIPTGAGNSLRYTLPPDFLTGSFSIEMNVKGSALKRIYNPGYVLFDIPGIGSGNGFRLSTFNGSLFLGGHSTTQNNQVILSSFLNNNSHIDNGKFYKVIASYINGSAKIEINGNVGTLTSSTCTNTTCGGSFITTLNPGVLSVFNIGSYYTGSSYIGQWNDIIDSVKIYKN